MLIFLFCLQDQGIKCIHEEARDVAERAEENGIMLAEDIQASHPVQQAIPLTSRHHLVQYTVLY